MTLGIQFVANVSKPHERWPLKLWGARKPGLRIGFQWRRLEMRIYFLGIRL